MNKHKMRKILALMAASISLAFIIFISFSLYNIFSSLPGNFIAIPKSIENRISFGGEALVEQEEVSIKSEEFRQAKGRGVEAFALGNYEQAVEEFETAIKAYRNAPETLIYLNNARIGNKEAYTIAVAVPIGTDLNGALEGLRGVAQAQHEINQAGGIDGVPLKVAIASDENNAEIAKQIAEYFVQNSEILGVVGHFSSDITLAAGQVYSSSKLAVISAASTSIELSKHPNIFRTVPSDALAARALASYMQNTLGQQDAAVLYDPDSNYSQSLKSEFVAAISSGGGEVVDEIDLSEASFDPLRSVNRAVERDAQALMLAPTPELLDKALQVVEVNRQRLHLLGGDVVHAPTTLSVGSEEAIGMVVAVSWHIDAARDSSFPQESRELWEADVSWLSAMAYDATQALIEAISRSPERTGVLESLKASDFSARGASGTIRFQRTGDRNGPVQLVKVADVGSDSRSGTGYDFVPVPLE